MLVNSGAKRFISGLSAVDDERTHESRQHPAGARGLLNAFETTGFLASKGRVNGLYFWTQVGAEKSVKYDVLTPVLPSIGAQARCGLVFFPYISVRYCR